MTPQQKAYRLLGILQSYAKTPQQMQACANVYNRAVMEEVPYEDITRVMVMTLADGLSYGNWPWSTWTQGRDSIDVIEANKKSEPGLRKMRQIEREAINEMRRPDFKCDAELSVDAMADDSQ